MKTQIKMYGGSKVIVLSNDFCKFQGLSVGDWVDVSDLVKVNQGEER